jgi:large subunit ribosomal protein L3
VEVFKPGEKVDVTGTSRGMGFAGVMKRHHFSGANATHGQSDRWRAPGSIGQSSYPSRTFPGQRMPGRMGGETATVVGLRVVRVIPEENLILIKGGVPGKANSFLKIKKSTRR